MNQRHSSSNQAQRRTRPDTSIGLEVLHTFPNIQEWEGIVKAALTARVIKRGGKVFLDIREYQKSKLNEGFTRRGLRLTLTEISRIAALLPEATRMIEEALAAQTA